MPAGAKVGSVSRTLYEEIVTEDRQLVLDETKIQFKVGDDALEIAPMTGWGGSQPASSDGPGVVETLEMFAEDVPRARSGGIATRPAGGRTNIGRRASRSRSTASWISWKTGSSGS